MKTSYPIIIDPTQTLGCDAEGFSYFFLITILKNSNVPDIQAMITIPTITTIK
jgi:hypothetical protein